MVTIKDIANKLDLNFSTVSRALNNKPGVSDKTRKLIIETAKNMNYRPNTIARSLATRSTKTIAVILPDILNPIFGEITTGIIEQFNQKDYNVFLCISNWDSKKELNYLKTAQQKQVDGIIINFIDNNNATFFDDNVIPAVGFESWMATKKICSVGTDNFKGGYIAAEHLIQSGYKYPAIISGPQTSSSTLERNEGFIKGCEDNKIKFDKSKIYNGQYNISSGFSLASRIFSEHRQIDSIFAENDVIAWGVMDYLLKNNIKVGEDIGLIGFDNIRFSNLPQIQLSSINQQEEGIGKLLANLLFDEIQNDKNNTKEPPRRVLLEPNLVSRMTTKNS